MSRLTIAAAILILAACSGRPGAVPGTDASLAPVPPDAAPAPVPPDAAPADRAGCDRARLRPVSPDRAARGPWPVGLRTVRTAGLVIDVYYPASPGSEVGQPPAAFELRDHLPPDAAATLAPGDVPVVPCACVRDLPLDVSYGPYPVVLFFHGLGLTRAEFPSLAAHLASRGLVVLAPDLPGVHLAALAARAPRPSLAGAIAPLLDALAAPAGELAFLAGRIAPRFGLVGHSLGALVVEALAAAREDVVVAIALAEQGVRATGRPLTTLVMGGTRDGFEPWRKQQRGFEGSGAPKRLVGVKDAGHMAFADHCAVAADAGGWYGAARARGVSLPGFLGALAERGCRDGALAIARAHAVILAAVTATLEETLACDPSAAATFVGLRTHPDVAEVREALAR